ncbi:2-oxoadipate dioxygenase/decarboxylase family protein [Thalassotalea fusca]
MTAQVIDLFNNIWKNYLEVTPSAEKIHQLLGSGNDLINDHVAYRTFNHDKVNIEKLAAHLIALGYEESGEYHFEAKKLYAKHYEHADSTMPKVFISQLLTEEFSAEAQVIINKIVDAIDPSLVAKQEFLYSGKSWNITSDEYKTLLAESEYAAWLAAWGYRANHFTVSVNHLTSFNDVESVNASLKDSGFTLNTSGGEIKGGEAVKLAQSSTIADKVTVQFSDKALEIPSCFYEFAKRYPLANGELYTGFVAASADKIFESTNAAA